uniref:Uncharacterized protein n=1 Tax=Lactuca sativa TaxID=4236 RepID=A0A9R1WMY0_LACSA|nr:hypothetical protein LSAT_V11C100021130 [Lactuca sativa]
MSNSGDTKVDALGVAAKTSLSSLIASSLKITIGDLSETRYFQSSTPPDSIYSRFFFTQLQGDLQFLRRLRLLSTAYWAPNSSPIADWPLKPSPTGGITSTAPAASNSDGTFDFVLISPASTFTTTASSQPSSFRFPGKNICEIVYEAVKLFMKM